MSGFNFERDLPHQQAAVESIMGVFHNLGVVAEQNKTSERVINPAIDVNRQQYIDNLMAVQGRNQINTNNKKFRNNDSHVLDISMETGTGKTYTYTKAMFELNRHFGINKFIIIVPTLSIKAGTVSFLRSHAAKEHFRQDYGRELRAHVVESKKGSKKNKKSYMPQAVSHFVEASSLNQSHIHMLVINAGMINSPTMSEVFDVTLFDKYSTPFEAIASVRPFTIIDEPHKFSQQGVTWSNIGKFESQFILRFGATFNDQYENLIHQLTAVDAFNQDLVKGVVTYVEDFPDGQNVFIRLAGLDGKEASFELNDHGKKKTVKLAKKESMSNVHHEMDGVVIENINKSVVVLSNGLELKRTDRINPYSYAESLQDKMMRQAVAKHFELERELLTRKVKIKPLSLFFIDDIEGYRGDHQIAGSLKKRFEAMLKAEAERLLATETNEFYKNYLEVTLSNLDLVHGGYFSKDNSESDEKIEKEIEEILHDKEGLLSLDNPRRFIFSKWTLREGWDNPNVFQICKLRSSGSQTSKLQEVGRGLRLPVNEYMSRVKDEKFDLHYYVDFTEREFAQSLVNEINEKSGGFSGEPSKLTDDLIQRIIKKYPEYDEDSLLEKLDDQEMIKRNNDFKNGGYNKLVAMFPNAFATGGALKGGKVRNAGSSSVYASIRAGKYAELKQLWEAINQKVVLEYKIKDESEFADLLKGYFKEAKDKFQPQGSKTHTQRLTFKDDVAFYREEESLNNEVLPIVTMSYKAFLLELANAISANISTLHQVFLAIQSDLDINHYRNIQTVRTIASGFNKFLLDNAFSKFQVGYAQVSSSVHPTYFTDEQGQPYKKVKAGRLGVHFDREPTATHYLFDELFYDSPLEKENIVLDIEQITVFTKIPKSSIRIPVAGGGTYSPDFAYVVERKDGKKSLKFIVETKDKDARDLFKDEEQRIKHAENLFNQLNPSIEIVFETQFKSQHIVDLIKAQLPAVG
jgi:type III restriction enzyme